MATCSDPDIMKRRIAELEAAERFFRGLFESSLDAVLLIDPDIGIFECNPATVKMFHAPHKGAICGLQPAELSPLEQSGCLPSKALAMQYISEAIEVGQKQFEWQARCLDGELFSAHISLIAIPICDQTVLECVVRDISDIKLRELESLRIRKELERANHELQIALEQLQHTASTDHLTAAWNRHFFNRVITTERARAARTGQPLTLILIDIDHFKAINDAHGHLLGDEVLKEVAQTLQQALRITDYLIRWGGEEFAVLAPDLDERQGMMLAERLREEIALREFNAGIRVTISAGVAQLDDDDILTKWVSRADDALYSAKHSGRNQVVVGRA